MLLHLRLHRKILQNSLLSKSFASNALSLSHAIVARPFSCGPLLSRQLGRTNKLSILNLHHRKVITKSFSLISKTRLPDRFYWLTVAGFTSFWGFLAYACTIDNSGGLIDRLNNTADLEDIAATWQSIYESLQYGDEWEKFLKKDIVPLGMAQLTGLYILVPFGAIARYHLERKREKLSEDSEEYAEATRELYNYALIMQAVEKISATLSRLCELEYVAEYIVRLNGFELITNFTLFGVDNYYLGDLYNSLLKHKNVQEILLERDGFIERLEALAAARHPPYSMRQVYNTLLPMMRNDEMREKILQNERINTLISKFNAANDDGFHKFFDDIFKMPVSTWDTHTREPYRKIVFQDRKDMRKEIVKVMMLGAATAVYCGIRWKRTLPNLANSILVRKMAAAFVGISSGDLVVAVLKSNIVNGPAAREELNDPRLWIDPKKSKFYSFHRWIHEIVTDAGILIYFIALYNVKFIVLPVLIQIGTNLLRLPTKKEIERGEYFQLNRE